MNEYVIRRTETTPPLSGDITHTAWAEANVLEISEYPWYTIGQQQGTSARILYDDSTLYLQFQCVDRHISSEVTELNGPVCMDSCVEFFATPAPAEQCDYFNLEINCCGVFHLAYGPGRGSREKIDAAWASKIRIATSIASPTKAESPDDDGWWVAVAVPFEVVSHMADRAVAPTAGTSWRANLYRCGGKTDPQYAVWNPINADRWPTPDFHRPEEFGTMRFS